MQESDYDNNPLFGKYEVGRLLGRGAFAKVYHARDLRSGQSVAIKVFTKTHGLCSFSTKREISIMRRLRHPNIVRLLEVLATKTKIYFVMEYVKGGELFAIVDKGRLTEDLARKFFRQLISAVDYCHSRGVFHRDLKLENLLMDESCNVKVTDFGLSSDQPSCDLLQTLCGTPTYVAPEILAKKGYYGAGVDIWSCGVILFALTAGYLPFNDHNLMHMYKKIYKGSYRCPKWMSGELKHLISRLLDTKPDTRMTIEGLKSDPWFAKGLEPESPVNYGEATGCWSKLEDEESSLNAFHLISYSSGLDLSGLLDEAAEDSDRVVSCEEPSRVMGRMSEFAAGERVRLRRSKGGLKVQLIWPRGELLVEVEVHQLTDELIMVEAHRRGGESAAYQSVWKNKLRTVLAGYSNDAL